MKTNEDLWEICMDIYREMYSKASPKANFDDMIKKKITQKEGWFLKYCLDENEQRKIVQKHCKKHRLSERDAYKISIEVNLGCAPTSVKKRLP